LARVDCSSQWPSPLRSPRVPRRLPPLPREAPKGRRVPTPCRLLRTGDLHPGSTRDPPRTEPPPAGRPRIGAHAGSCDARSSCRHRPYPRRWSARCRGQPLLALSPLAPRTPWRVPHGAFCLRAAGVRWCHCRPPG
jgi:hypothetical protein